MQALKRSAVSPFAFGLSPNCCRLVVDLSIQRPHDKPRNAET
jgi:hypothetical protein